MPRYLITMTGQPGEDVVIEDAQLTLEFQDGWALFSDDAGIYFALPDDLGATIRRLDDTPTGTEPPGP